jgi:hypothetical protein
MAHACFLLALCLAAADAPAPQSSRAIQYQVQVMEMADPQWRGAFHARLEPVTKTGTPTVWTAAAVVAPNLAGAARTRLGDWAIRAVPGQTARIFRGTERPYLARPATHGARPQVDIIHDGFTAAMTCQSVIDQGIVAHVSLADTRFDSFTTVACPEQTRNASGDTLTRIAPYQVATVDSKTVEGDWMIPTDGVLVLSLGLRSTKGENGEPLVRERLAVVSARAVDADVPQPIAPPAPPRPATVDRSARVAEFSSVSSASPPPPPAVIALALTLASPMTRPIMAPPLPELPSRSLPVPIGPDGAVVPLPPLPEEPVPADDSADPKPTPQLRPPTVAPQPPQDRALNGRWAAPRDSAAARASLQPGAPAARTITIPIRVPLTGPRTIEIRATIVPAGSQPR